MQELIVALHMHTVYSDGTGKHADLAAAGLKAGVDVLIVTDHNVLVNDIEGYTQEGKRRLLLLSPPSSNSRSCSPCLPFLPDCYDALHYTRSTQGDGFSASLSRIRATEI